MGGVRLVLATGLASRSVCCPGGRRQGPSEAKDMSIPLLVSVFISKPSLRAYYVPDTGLAPAGDFTRH